jgi:Cys-rich repeat protein
MKCFALSSPGECEAPEPETPDLLRRKACAANSHCAAGEYCDPGAGLPCGGPGFCQSRTNCGSSWGSPLCGCDGKTYPNLQTACLAGVRTVGGGRCGATINIGQGGNSAGITRTLCGQDSQCPSGERCCHLTGFCYDDAHAALCATPPPGTNYPCITNQDCFTGDFCDAPSCDGPGGCKQMEICDALLEPVCGCDGKTYVNPPCAASKGVRVASEGQCHQSQ